MPSFRILQIVPGTSVDGPGLRTSVYFAGCTHRCPGCHNPESWDFAAGEEMDIDRLADIIIAHGFNVTFTGGDPLQQPDLTALGELADRLREAGLKIWCYTGFRFEELATQAGLAPLLAKFEAIVEGPFIEDERDTSLRFRGSRNQRIMRPDGSPYPLG